LYQNHNINYVFDVTFVVSHSDYCYNTHMCNRLYCDYSCLGWEVTANNQSNYCPDICYILYTYFDYLFVSLYILNVDFDMIYPEAEILCFI